MKHHRCLRCGHTWIPRMESKPTQCPKCRSPYWTKPRQRPHQTPQFEKALEKYQEESRPLQEAIKRAEILTEEDGRIIVR